MFSVSVLGSALAFGSVSGVSCGHNVLLWPASLDHLREKGVRTEQHSETAKWSKVLGAPKDHWEIPTGGQGTQWTFKQILQIFVLEVDLQMVLSHNELNDGSIKNISRICDVTLCGKIGLCGCNYVDYLETRSSWFRVCCIIGDKCPYRMVDQTQRRQSINGCRNDASQATGCLQYQKLGERADSPSEFLSL